MGIEGGLRLGMRLVKGISRRKVAGIEAARREGAFVGVADVVHRAGVSRGVLARLAAANAFRSMGLNRREAVWQVLAVDNAQLPLFDGMEADEVKAELPALSLTDTVVSDYDTVGLSLEAHPISLLRRELDGIGAVQAGKLKRMRHGHTVCVVGLVLVRQRPSTASGIVFYTLEDETGVANLIVRPRVYERCRGAARGAAALIADGRVERQGEVVHVQVSHLRGLGSGIEQFRLRSRDFH